MSHITGLLQKTKLPHASLTLEVIIVQVQNFEAVQSGQLVWDRT